ncbi:hypothetical protein TNCV_4001981 [Trichonephila clavipes]|uniref:Uncharacterized protein n=1 Tax=Trichonephila clavipes TaxID=2585209 RepID=A0A8X6V9Y6_TRICX|nr:hypothetical protein TNCV_4001981 [Trichonephila clavipes]
MALTANRVLAYRSLTTNSRRAPRLLARIWTLNFLRPLKPPVLSLPLFSFRVHQSGCTITNTGNQRQAPNISMERRNASRSSAQ